MSVRSLISPTHFPTQLNRFMLVYWIAVALLRFVLQTLLLFEIFANHILEEAPYETLYTLIEVLDYGKPQCYLSLSRSECFGT